jgi:hypothetical protein
MQADSRPQGLVGRALRDTEVEQRLRDRILLVLDGGHPWTPIARPRCSPARPPSTGWRKRYLAEASPAGGLARGRTGVVGGGRPGGT